MNETVTSDPHPIARRLFLWATAALTIAFLAALALNLSPALRGPDEWRWTYALPGKPARLAIPAATLAAYVIIVLTWATRMGKESGSSGRHIGFLLAFLVLAVPVIQASLMALDHPDVLRPLFYRTVSVEGSGVFSVGSTIEDIEEFLRRYPALMPTFPVHPQRYPPGLPVLFALTRRLLERLPSLSDSLGFHLRQYQCHDLQLMRLPNATIGSAIIQMALPLVSGLVVLPLYSLARRAYGRRTALLAAVLYPLIPSFALWSGRWEQFYPLLACGGWALFYAGLAQARQDASDPSEDLARARLTKSGHLAMLGAGFVLSLASLLNFSVLAILLPMGLFALLWWLSEPPATRLGLAVLAGHLVAFSIGLVPVWIAVQIAFGTGFLDIWRVSMGYHLSLERDYWTWLFYHLYDFFIFLGLPLALAFLVAMGFGVTDLAGTRKPSPHASVSGSAAGERHPRRRRIDTLALGFALGLLLLDISGTSRGEVARVWLFLTPFAVIVATRGLTRLRLSARGLAVVTSLLALQLFTFNTFLRVVNTGLSDPPDRPRTYTPPTIAQPVNARFEIDGVEAVALLGYQLEPQTPTPGDTLRLTLYWQALAPIAHPYTVFSHLLGPDGQLISQQDNMPLRNTAPTTCWIPGEIIADPYDLPISPHVIPGDYTLETGLYLWETGERLPVTGPKATPDGRIILAEVALGER
jgi:hypothetical protein